MWAKRLSKATPIFHRSQPGNRANRKVPLRREFGLQATEFARRLGAKISSNSQCLFDMTRLPNHLEPLFPRRCFDTVTRRERVRRAKEAVNASLDACYRRRPANCRGAS